MKKTLFLTVLSLLVLSAVIVSCSGKDAGDQTGKTTGSENTVITAEVTAKTEAVTTEAVTTAAVTTEAVTTAGPDNVPSAQLLAELSAAWEKQHSDPIFLEAGSRELYGVFNGYVVFLRGGMLPVVSEREIAGSLFTYGSTFSIYLYKDGAFTEIEDAYNSGLIDVATIKSIAEVHKERVGF